MSFLTQIFKKGKKGNPFDRAHNKQSNPTQQDLTAILCQTWKQLDVNILEPFLDEDFKYNSVWVGSTLKGKTEYIQYLKRKYETFKNTDSCPVMDVINEYGIALPHFLQGDREGVLDYECKNGKITHILMRPLLKIRVVSNPEWESYAQAYRDFLPQAVQIAGHAIQHYVNERGYKHPEFAWLQARINYPSFQHLCFRRGTQIYSIIIALHGFSSDGKDDNSIVVNKKDYDLLLEESEKNNLIPCLLPVCGIPGMPMLRNCPLIHARTSERIKLDEDVNNSVIMSPWELNNMGIFTVINYLQKQGFSNISYCDVVGINPQIFCEKDGKKSFVIVRSIPVGLRNNAFEINNNMLRKLEGYEAYFADVQYANEHNNGNFEDKKLWRGDGYYCKFSGLQELRKAIADNPFIKCVDKESYDIN